MNIDAFKICFWLAFIVSLFSAFVKILNFMNADFLMIVSVLLTITYMIIGIINVNNSSRSFSSKLLWSLGFIFLNFFTGILWLINRRKM